MTRDVPQRFQKLYRKAKTGRSQSAAIRSFCLECVGYEYEEVKLCTDSGCPLYEYRLTGRKVPATTGTAHRIAPTRIRVHEIDQTAPISVGVDPG